MEREEICRRYMIPAEVLDEYERWELCAPDRQPMDRRQFDERDLERLSLILSLHGIGFSSVEVEAYMRLALAAKETSDERLKMLDRLRSRMLEEIHLRERQIDQLDYLRHRLSRSNPFGQEDPQ